MSLDLILNKRSSRKKEGVVNPLAFKVYGVPRGHAMQYKHAVRSSFFGFSIFSFVCSLSFLTSSCGNPFAISGNHSIIDMGHIAPTPTPYKLAPAKGTEMVSLSAQYVPTVKKAYLIQAAVANMNGGIRATTTQSKIIYSSAQGNLISGTSK